MVTITQSCLGLQICLKPAMQRAEDELCTCAMTTNTWCRRRQMDRSAICVSAVTVPVGLKLNSRHKRHEQGVACAAGSPRHKTIHNILQARYEGLDQGTVPHVLTITHRSTSLHNKHCHSLEDIPQPMGREWLPSGGPPSGVAAWAAQGAAYNYSQTSAAPPAVASLGHHSQTPST